METIEAPAASRQSKAREREGYSWASIKGLPVDALEEIYQLKVALGISWRDDVVDAILGEVGLLDAAAKRGFSLLAVGKDATQIAAFISDGIIAAAAQAAKVMPIEVRPAAVLAAALMGVRSDFEKLARQGLRRKMEGAS